MSRLVAVLVAGAVTGLTVLVGFLGLDDPERSDRQPAPGTSAASSSGSTAIPSAKPLPTADPVPRPPRRACYRLAYDDAVAPTTERREVPCDDPHTSVTYLVGRLDTVVDGHLLAVDSERVQEQVAETCPRRLAGFVGGTIDQRRLSMLRAVWFTPSVKQSDDGADWFRCDVIAVAGDERLAELGGPVAGVMDNAARRTQYAMCGTAEPGTEKFERVICSVEHSWRAIRTVPFATGSYPGESQVRDVGEATCEGAGRAVADDPLDFSWGYEWPTAEQWREGQTFGICWAPV